MCPSNAYGTSTSHHNDEVQKNACRTVSTELTLARISLTQLCFYREVIYAKINVEESGR